MVGARSEGENEDQIINIFCTIYYIKYPCGQQDYL
jgi:hypothetical protein